MASGDPPHSSSATQLSQPLTLTRYLNEAAEDQPFHGIGQVVRVPHQARAARPVTPPNSTMSSSGYIDVADTRENSEQELDGRKIKDIAWTAFALGLTLGATNKAGNIKKGLDTMKTFEETFDGIQRANLEDEEQDKENHLKMDEAANTGASEGGSGGERTGSKRRRTGM